MSGEIEAMAVITGVAREVNDALKEALTVLHVRVTPDALEGSPVAVPITPERARRIKLIMLPGGAAEASPEVTERCREILLHPHDWATVLVALPRDIGHAVGSHSPPFRLLGYEVVE